MCANQPFFISHLNVRHFGFDMRTAIIILFIKNYMFLVFLCFGYAVLLPTSTKKMEMESQA